MHRTPEKRKANCGKHEYAVKSCTKPALQKYQKSPRAHSFGVLEEKMQYSQENIYWHRRTARMLLKRKNKTSFLKSTSSTTEMWGRLDFASAGSKM